MARLKRDNSSWHAHGLYKKYQEPRVVERPASKRLKKRNTNLWCRGKVGVEHSWHIYQKKRWNDDRWAFLNIYLEVHCAKCKKEKYIKTAKSRTYPFHAWINQSDSERHPIQVKVNGKPVPIPAHLYHPSGHWCSECGTWH